MIVHVLDGDKNRGPVLLRAESDNGCIAGVVYLTAEQAVDLSRKLAAKVAALPPAVTAADLGIAA